MDIILHDMTYVNIKKEVVHMEDRCVVCGDAIPEGSHICGRCREDGGQAARNMIRVQGRQIEHGDLIGYLAKRYNIKEKLEDV